MPTLTTNLLRNPSAETNTTDAAVSGGFTLSRDIVDFYVGIASFETLTDGTGGQSKRFVVSSNTSLGLTGVARRFFGAMVLKGDAGNDVRVDVQLNYTDASNEIITGTLHTLTADWTRVASPVITADPAKTVNQVAISARVVTAAVFTFFADALIIHEGAVLSSYFDGATSDTATSNFAWTGTAHASTSTHTDFDDGYDSFAQLR
jgi:hypothetical protein